MEKKAFWKSQRIQGLAILALSLAFPKISGHVPDIVQLAGEVIGGAISIFGMIKADTPLGLKDQKAEQ